MPNSHDNQPEVTGSPIPVSVEIDPVATGVGHDADEEQEPDVGE
ncbi:hypothetical protein [Saccharopolyspora soli]|nr:hypothetical protein [Saccharopolyspora soli]